MFVWRSSAGREITFHSKRSKTTWVTFLLAAGCGIIRLCFWGEVYELGYFDGPRAYGSRHCTDGDGPAAGRVGGLVFGLSVIILGVDEGKYGVAYIRGRLGL